MKTINSFISEKLKITKKMLDNQYDYVDLDLPSGTLWAKCNVGAKTETEYGDYFAWGETKPKSTYNWATRYAAPSRPTTSGPTPSPSTSTNSPSRRPSSTA